MRGTCEAQTGRAKLCGLAEGWCFRTCERGYPARATLRHPPILNVADTVGGK